MLLIFRFKIIRKMSKLILFDEAPLFKMNDYQYTKRKIEEEEDV